MYLFLRFYFFIFLYLGQANALKVFIFGTVRSIEKICSEEKVNVNYLQGWLVSRVMVPLNPVVDPAPPVASRPVPKAPLSSLSPVPRTCWFFAAGPAKVVSTLLVGRGGSLLLNGRRCGLGAAALYTMSVKFPAGQSTKSNWDSFMSSAMATGGRSLFHR